MDRIGSQNIKPAGVIKLCSKHFEEKFLNRTLSVVRLKDNVIPTLLPRATRGLLIEPYVSSFQVYANYTNASQKKPVTIPKLPVPKLKDTLDRYLQSVKPFLNTKQLKKTTNLLKDFEQGVGTKLQALLEKRASERDNWLAEWWINAAYLEYRDPVVVYSSPGLLFPHGTVQKKANGPLEFAAKMLLATIEYRDKIKAGKLRQEYFGKNPLDMDPYRKIFGTCRIPMEKRDQLVYNEDSRHVIVLHNDHIFRLDLYGKDNVQLNEDQIVEQLKVIENQSLLQNPERVGILTSEQRDQWAKAYQLLMKDSKNQEYMKDIHESIVAVCLDAPCGYLEGETPDFLRSRGGAQTIHGGGSKSNGGNRWHDKTLQYIVGDEGLAGMTYEHSPADGQPVAMFTNFIVDYIEKRKDTLPPSKSPIEPKYLDFRVTPEIRNMMTEAEVNLDELTNNFFFHCFKFTGYGKKFIKSLKLSPDSYIQTAFQYAFYKLHREPGAHYESASTRMFKGGRTETIRSCSVESIHFAKTMLNREATKDQKIKALKSAIEAHKKYAIMALQAQGVDRHLLGLKFTAVENGLPVHALYEDISYKKSTHMRISTSQVAFKSEAFMGYGPLVNNGYATCYNPREDDMLFAISTFKDDPDTALYGYKDALEKALFNMQQLFVHSTPSKL